MFKLRQLEVELSVYKSIQFVIIPPPSRKPMGKTPTCLEPMPATLFRDCRGIMTDTYRQMPGVNISMPMAAQRISLSPEWDLMPRYFSGLFVFMCVLFFF